MATNIYNPLDDFQSYSVHYVLLACRTTEVAKTFASEKPESMTEALAAIDRVQALGGSVNYQGRDGDIFLVLDTRRFSQFTVENLKYDVYVNGLHTGDSPANLAADLSMTILDSAGISFAHFMQWIIDDRLKTNYDGLIFMLRTIFVGHLETGETRTVSTETIPMHLNTMEIDLNYAKGAYTLEFMPNMNFDVNRHGRFLTVSNATTYNSSASTVVEMVASLEAELNRLSQKYYDDVQAIMGKKYGRRVRYQITLPASWAPYKMQGPSQGNAPETIWQTVDKQTKKTEAETSAAKAESYTSVNAGITIDKALDAILKQSPDIAELGNYKSSLNAEGEVVFFKYLIGLTTDDDTLCVHVDVIEFKVPHLIFDETTVKSSTVSQLESDWYTVDPQTGKRTPKDLIEYDFIFTGKNKDILNFDMKIQDFQFLLASNLRIGDGAMREVSDNADQPPKLNAGANDVNSLLYSREYDPLFMPMQTQAALDNLKQYKTRDKAEADKAGAKYQQYLRNLSMFYAGSPIVTTITIKGNPLIMHKFNMGTILEHPKTSGGSTLSSSNDYRTNLEAMLLKSSNGVFSRDGDAFVLKRSPLSSRSYATSPVFAKINVKGPNVDFRTGLEIDGDYATSVLSDNYYVIFKVTNSIQGHAFTQDLELYSHNMFGLTKINKDTAK